MEKVHRGVQKKKKGCQEPKNRNKKIEGKTSWTMSGIRSCCQDGKGEVILGSMSSLALDLKREK